MDNIFKIIELFVSPHKNGFPVLVIIAGTIFAYFGYDLFSVGVQDGGAALTVSFGSDRAFEMGRGGPGLIFCAFGMGLIIYAIRKFDKLRMLPERKVALDEDGQVYEIDESENKKLK